MKLARPSPHDWAISALLPIILALTWWLSQAALAGPFLFDDFPNFENLKEISGCLNGDRIARYLAAFTGTPGRPLSALSFLIDDYAWPSNPYSWKRHNLLLHLLCGVLVFGLTRTLAAVRHSRTTANWVALGVVAAWLLHPMQFSTSMLTVQRMTQLMTLSSLAGCWLVAHRLATRPITSCEYIRLLCASALMTVVAFLCKENGALLPLYVMVISAWILHNRPRLPSSRPTRLYFIALCLPIAAIVIGLAYAAAAHDSNGIRTFNPWERLLTESRIIWSYLRQILLPRLNGSGIFHDEIVVSRSLVSPITTLPSVIGIVGLTIVALTKRNVWPLLAFAVVWFLGGHLMESTTLPLELYFEHRNYLPMIGVLIAIGITLPSIASKKIRYSAVLASVAWITMCTAMTFNTASVWGSANLQSAIWATEHPDSLRSLETQAKIIVDSGDLLTAGRLVESAIHRDRRFNGLAIHSLLIDCYTGRLTTARMNRAASLLKEADYNRSTLNSLSLLRDAFQNRRCGLNGPKDKWGMLATTLLENKSFGSADAISYIHVEMVRDGMNRGDFNSVVQHLDAAYASSPNPTLAGALAYVLTDGGYLKEAAVWRERAQRLPQPWPVPWLDWLKRITSMKADSCPT